MSKTLLNRLAMFEVLDAQGPLTITDLARRCGLDITVVSRTVSACEPEGWLVREEGKVELGPRCALLAHGSHSARVIAAAEPLAHAIAGVTGLFTHVSALVGSHAVLVAAAEGRGPTDPSVAAGLAAKTPLHATAAGRAIAAQLMSDRLAEVLPAEPYPDAAATIAGLAGTQAAAMFARPAGDREPLPPLPRTRGELDVELAEIRATGFALDRGALHPAVHCIATAWPQRALVASFSCLGTPRTMAHEAAVIRRVLRAAVRPGATAADVVAAAAR
jgi:DNA-binding IclR family transcriptional regulator